MSLTSRFLGKNDQDDLYSQKVFSLYVILTGTQMQTRYPVNSDTANIVTGDGLTTSTPNFLRVDATPSK